LFSIGSLSTALAGVKVPLVPSLIGLATKRGGTVVTLEHGSAVVATPPKGLQQMEILVHYIRISVQM
jgi:hypothetical protein